MIARKYFNINALTLSPSWIQCQFCWRHILLFGWSKETSYFVLSSLKDLIFNGWLCSLANVDPIDIAKNIAGLNPETTLGKSIFLHLLSILRSTALHLIYGKILPCVVVVVSKTFTTAETMLNARTLREWISSALGYVRLIIINLFYRYNFGRSNVVLLSLPQVSASWHLC